MNIKIYSVINFLAFLIFGSIFKVYGPSFRFPTSKSSHSDIVEYFARVEINRVLVA